ncbi:MAG: family 2 glycosyl transferase, partial [Acidobacteria bacterium]|nr:family 2 glycosyl transferase [Acidobacteriota bacterium]
MSKPSMAVLIPTFQRADMLPRAIRSVLAQRYREVEVFICDNASTDGTAEVAAAFARSDSRVHYTRRDHNIGALENFNTAIRDVELPFFSLLSDDDFVLPDFCETAMSLFERHPAAFLACTRTIMLNEINGRVHRRNRSWTEGLYVPSVESVSHMAADHFITTGVVFRREIRETVGLFDPAGSDHNYLIVAAATHPFAVSDRECAVFLTHAGSFTSGLQSPAPQTQQQAAPGMSVAYVLATFFALLGRLYAQPLFSFTDRARLFRMLAAKARREVVYTYFTFSLQRGFVSEIDEVAAMLPYLGMPLWISLPVSLIRQLLRLPLMPRLLAGGVRSAIALSRWLRRAEHKGEFARDL